MVNQMLQHSSTQSGGQERRSKAGPSEPPASPIVGQRKRSIPGPSHSPVISNPSSPVTRVLKPENIGILRDLTLNKAISRPSTPIRGTLRDLTPKKAISKPSTPIRKPENSGNICDLIKNTGRAGPSVSNNPEEPSTQVQNVSTASPLKRKLEGGEIGNGSQELRKKNKVVHDDTDKETAENGIRNGNQELRKEDKVMHHDKENTEKANVNVNQEVRKKDTVLHHDKENNEKENTNDNQNLRKKDKVVHDDKKSGETRKGTGDSKGKREPRKKDKVVHYDHNSKELKEAVKEVVVEDEDSKLIDLGAETSSRALMHESVKALQEAKERGLYDEYTNPDRVVRIPRSSWLMKPKKKPEEKKLSTAEDKDTGALKRTLSELILLKPKKKHSEERDYDEPQESVRRTLSEAVKCRVQERRKRTELTASVKANLEEGFKKDKRVDVLAAQVAAYAEKVGVQIRKSEVQDELYELQKAKVAAQSQEICKLKGKLDSQKRTTEAVKLEQTKLKKEVEDAKGELEALKNLVGRMFVESSLKTAR